MEATLSPATLDRLTGGTAIVAGILRAIDSFAFKFLDAAVSDRLFLITDIALLLALFGLYGRVCRDIGWAGLAGFAVAVVGIAVVRSAGGIIDTYVVGAAIVALGVAILGAAMLRRRAAPPAAPALWIVALVAGFAAYGVESDWLFELAGVAFGLGFVIAGIERLGLRPTGAGAKAS